MKVLLTLAVLPFLAGTAAGEIVLAAREEPLRFERDGAAHPVLRIPLGASTTLFLHNAGTTGHNWQVAGLAGIPFPVAPGATANVTFTAPRAGSFRYACLAHEAQGMHGQLEVEEAGMPLPGLLAVAALGGVALARRPLRSLE